MPENASEQPPIASRKGAERYYRHTDIEMSMNLFESALPAYWYVLEEFVKFENPKFSQNTPEGLCILGGFYPSRRNVEALHSLAAAATMSPNQCLYLDINEEPAQVLNDDEKIRFHQVNLSELQKLLTAEGQPVIPEGSVKLIVLDHVTEFMDDESLAKFFQNLSKILTPDGVALMSTVDVISLYEKIWRRIRNFLTMGAGTHIRRQSEWQSVITLHLDNPCVFSFPLGQEYRKLYVLSKNGSPYGTGTVMNNWGEDEFTLYVRTIPYFNRPQLT